MAPGSSGDQPTSTITATTPTARPAATRAEIRWPMNADRDDRGEQRRRGVQQRGEPGRQRDGRDRDQRERHGREQGADDQEGRHATAGDPERRRAGDGQQDRGADGEPDLGRPRRARPQARRCAGRGMPRPRPPRGTGASRSRRWTVGGGPPAWSCASRDRGATPPARLSTPVARRHRHSTVSLRATGRDPAIRRGLGRVDGARVSCRRPPPRWPPSRRRSRGCSRRR